MNVGNPSYSRELSASRPLLAGLLAEDILHAYDAYRPIPLPIHPGTNEPHTEPESEMGRWTRTDGARRVTVKDIGGMPILEEILKIHHISMESFRQSSFVGGMGQEALTDDTIIDVGAMRDCWAHAIAEASHSRPRGVLR